MRRSDSVHDRRPGVSALQIAAVHDQFILSLAALRYAAYTFERNLCPVCWGVDVILLGLMAAATPQRMGYCESRESRTRSLVRGWTRVGRTETTG